MNVDLREARLTNRRLAAAQLEALGGEIERGGAVVLDLRSNVAGISWLDGFLRGLIGRTPERQIAAITEDEDLIEVLAIVADRLGRALYVATSPELLAKGEAVAIGHITAAQHSALATIRFGEKLAVVDVAARLGCSVEAAQLRLSDLLAIGLVTRSKIGRAYTYERATFDRVLSASRVRLKPVETVAAI
ncbi:MAG: hypothetical protein ACP5O6_02530 [Candidatus Baltobacteraceae bacterium]